MTQTVLYARVSTTEQALDHQETQARAAGFEIDVVLADHGVSGVAVPIKDRPQGRRLFDVLRKGDILVVRWIDRLGRNYADVVATVQELLNRGVTIKTVINGMTFDGSAKDPMSKAVRDALLGFMAAMAEAQAETTREAQRAGIAAAKEKGEAYKGRKPSYNREKIVMVMDLLSQGKSPAEVARLTGLSRPTVYRIKEDPAHAESLVAGWQWRGHVPLGVPTRGGRNP